MTQTKLTEPVQVGLWYETKAGEKVFIVKHKNPSEKYRFQGNNGFSYTRKGKLYYDDISNHDLIRCLGADPFTRVDKALDKRVFEIDFQGGYFFPDGKIIRVPTTDKTLAVAPTQFERILTAMLGGFSQNHLFDEPKDFIAYAIKATQEAIKQLKEIEGA